MTYDELRDTLMEFFGDKSRSAGQTKSGLLEIAEEAQVLADTIEDAPEFEEDE